MTRRVEVRLKNDTVDEFVDPPLPWRSGGKVEVQEHRHQLNDDGSLDLLLVVFEAYCAPVSREYIQQQLLDQRQVAHYLKGQFTSFRELVESDET